MVTAARNILFLLDWSSVMSKKITLLLLGTLLAVGPAVAQRDGNRGGHAPSAGSSAMHAPPIFRGGPRGPAGWETFHHDTAPAKAAPHRLGATNLPRPNAWRGNVHDFDLGTWQGGRWFHGDHGGRSGWWWTVGPDWYFFNAPVYPYPDLYTPFGYPLGWWYWCDAAQDYYPYVTYCEVPWESVMPVP